MRHLNLLVACVFLASVIAPMTAMMIVVNHSSGTTATVYNMTTWENQAKQQQQKELEKSLIAADSGDDGPTANNDQKAGER